MYVILFGALQQTQVIEDLVINITGMQTLYEL